MANVNEKEMIFKDSKLKTNIDELNVILEGGLQKGSSILLEGPSCEEKLIAGLNLVITDDSQTMLICADESANEIKDKIKTNKLNEKSVAKYIDLTGKSHTTGNISNYDSINLNDISIEIKDFLDKNKGGQGSKIVFYSLSKILLTIREDSVIKFMKLVNERAKQYGAVVIYFLDETVHNDTILRKLKNNVSAEIKVIKQSNETNSITLIFENPHIEVPINISPEGRLSIL